jgi:hypothetical protein
MRRKECTKERTVGNLHMEVDELTLRGGVVDGRLGSWLRGYHPVTPRPISCRPSLHRLCSSTHHLQRRSTPRDMRDLC